MDSTREINVEDQSNVQVETNETPTHDVLETGNFDVIIEYEHHHSDTCVLPTQLNLSKSCVKPKLKLGISCIFTSLSLSAEAITRSAVPQLV
ncbi:hypothetical protein Tco_0053734 [Tanacetum coccineum]